MASMATMGHCSIYVVLLQTAVEGPGIADDGHHAGEEQVTVGKSGQEWATHWGGAGDCGQLWVTMGSNRDV